MRQRSKRLVSFLIIGVIALFLAACGNQGADSDGGGSNQETASGSENQDQDLLVVGMEAAYPPYNWTQADDSNGAVPIEGQDQYANGYDVQIAKRIAEAMGKDGVLVVKTKWEGIIPGLQADKYDLIIAGMTPTPERAEAINFTDPYYDMVFTMVTMKDSEYAGGSQVEDYEGITVTAQQGTMNYDLLQQIPNANIQQAMADFSSMRVALRSGKLDGYISEIPEAISATNAIPDFTYSVVEGFEIPEGTADHLAIGVKKGNDDLLEAVNQALADISDEEREEMMMEAINNQPAEAE